MNNNNNDSIKVSKNLHSRLLYTNPVCLLTSISPHSNQKNVMVVSWLTPISNNGKFIISINARRQSAENVILTKEFVLNIPIQGMETLLLKIGSTSGRDIDKVSNYHVKCCQPGEWCVDSNNKNILNDDILLKNDDKTSEELLKLRKQYSKLTALRANLKYEYHEVTSQLLESSTLAAFIRDTDTQLQRLKKSLEEQFDEKMNHDQNKQFALTDCIAHIVSKVDHIREIDAHYILDCHIEDAYVKENYWDGKIFAPKLNVLPYLTFFGSQTFGYVMPTNDQNEVPDSTNISSAMYPNVQKRSSIARPHFVQLHPNFLRIERCTLKVDHFEAIYRLKKIFEGAPNYREIPNFPVFGTGQPTINGFNSILAHLQQNGYKKYIWVCMRQEPVLYANDFSLAPRSHDNLNENMEFEDVNAEMIENLQDALVTKYRREGKHSKRLLYYRDTYAENPADRENHLLEEPIDNINNIQSLTDVFKSLQHNKYSVESVKLPIADERAPSTVDFDIMVSLLRNIDNDTAAIFNCQMGKGRTTTGTVCAILIYRVLHGGEKVETKNNEAMYEVIKLLVNKLKDGDMIKAEVDDAIDRADQMQNLRQCIEYTKTMYEKETLERREFWKRMSKNFVERYFYLICFHAYLKECSPKFTYTFTEWIQKHNDITSYLNNNLESFNWS